MGSPLCEVRQLAAEPSARSPVRLVKEVSLISGTAIAAVLISRSGLELAFFSENELSSVLAILAGAVSLATAAMWHVVRRLTGDGRASLCGAAMALYGLVAVPATTLGSVAGARGAIGAGRLAAHLVVVAFLLACSIESMDRWRSGSRTLLGTGLLVVLGAGTLGFVDPATALAVSQAPVLRWLVAAGWVIAGIRVSLLAVQMGLAPSVRVGLGLTLLAVAHGYRVATEPAQPEVHPSLTFAALRLVALWFIGLGTLRFGARALQGLSEQQRRWRHHRTELGKGGLAESALYAPAPVQNAFEFDPTVRAMAALHRAAGLDVRCEVATGLAASGSSELLSQVLDHLLTNCSQHAPKSPVTVWAWTDGERVVLRVSDRGPGVADEIQAEMFEQGVRGPESDGRGLGLHICRELLSANGGHIQLHRCSAQQVGCTIQVELPAVVELSGLGESPSTAAEKREATPTEVGVPRWATRVTDLAEPVTRWVVGLASRPLDLVPRAGRSPTPLRLGLALALLMVTFAISQIQAVSEWLSLKEVGVSLALVAVAGGVLSAFACAVLGQLADEAAGLWLCAGLTFYSVIAVPVATFNATSTDNEAAVGNLRVFAHAMLIVMTFAAVFAARRPLRDGWVALSGGLALSVGAAGLGVEYPAESIAVTANEAARYVFCGLWLMSGVALFVSGCARRLSWMCWAGIGGTVIAIAHTYRVVTGSPFIPLDATFSAIRLLGVLLLVAGVLPAARRVLIEAYASRQQQLVELHRAQTCLQKYAERDHELRNGLRGLANAAVLLASDTHPPEERDVLQAAATAELERLNVLLRPDDSEFRAQDYDVLPILQDRIALQTTPFADVRVDVEPHLRATGNPMVLSQVLANILANCDRHAPGSPLRIQAIRRAETVVLRVCDFGPGIPADLGGVAFDLGARGPASTGQGFGLHICRRLLQAESGQIYLKLRPVTGTGCTVVIELPAAAADRSGHPELTDSSTG